MSIVNASGSFSRLNCNRWLSREPETGGRVVIDLAGVTFVDPHGLVLIAIEAENAVRTGRTLEVIPPSDIASRNYLSRMGIGEILASRMPSQPFPSVRRSLLTDVLLEAQECSTEGEFEALAILAFERLSEWRYDPDSTNVPFAGLAELGANVIQHSRASFGFVAAQAYRRNDPDEYLEFAVGDAGIGVRASLQARYSPVTDLEALELARREGVSGTGILGRGIGITTLFDDATAINGDVIFWSGAGEYCEGTRNAGVRYVPEVVGTLLSVRVPCRPGR